MKRNTRKMIYFISACVALLLFVSLTAALKLIDVGAIGPGGSEIGLSTLNGFFRDFAGTNADWYDITEYIGMMSLLPVMFFALFGLCQLIKRRSFKKVDKDIYFLALSYIAVAVIYVFFEKCIINYRPVYGENNALEASFPSSHTMLAVCIMLTSAHQAFTRIKNRRVALSVCIFCGAVAAVTVAGRLMSGVHWLTDIIGGVLISSAVFLAYLGACNTVKRTSE